MGHIDWQSNLHLSETLVAQCHDLPLPRHGFCEHCVVRLHHCAHVLRQPPIRLYAILGDAMCMMQVMLGMKMNRSPPRDQKDPKVS